MKNTKTMQETTNISEEVNKHKHTKPHKTTAWYMGVLRQEMNQAGLRIIYTIHVAHNDLDMTRLM